MTRVCGLMTDILTKAERSDLMSRIRSKDTKPELIVRRLVHGMGYRYRLHRRDLPGTPDLVFPSRKKAIFVHGCYWHYHEDPACKLVRLPKSRLDYWKPKLERIRHRDQENCDKLRDMGWDVLVIWECEIDNRQHMQKALSKFLEKEHAGS